MPKSSKSARLQGGNEKEAKKHSKGKSKTKSHHSSSDNPNKNRGTSIKQVNHQDEEDEWVEKDPIENEIQLAPNTNHPESTGTEKNQVENPKLQRESWMVSQKESQQQHVNSTSQEAKDYLDDFASTYSSRITREKAEQEKANQTETPSQSSSSVKRLGAGDPEYQANASAVSAPIPTAPGGPGYQWRMTKLKRTYETAREENRSIEDVALERYGTLESWHQAVKEREYVEDRQNNRDSRSGRSTPRQQDSERRYMFTNRDDHSFNSMSDVSRPNSRSGFRKPNSALNTPEGSRLRTSTNRRLDEIRSQAQPSTSSNPNPIAPASSSATSTPLPSVINPLASLRASSSTPTPNNPISPSNLTTTLNKLQASILKAQIMDPKSVPELEKQYNQLKLSLESSKNNQSDLDNLRLVPTLDGRGRMYDVGNGAESDDLSKPGNNRRRKEAKFETRDPKTGELLRINPDDNTISLSEMVRQEKLQAGSADQKSLDVEIANRIAVDHKFENDLDYLDEHADLLARKKMKTDASKRLYAINDYKRTQKALETCQFCFKDDGNPPSNLGIVSTGTKVYLSCTQYEELVDGHCLIVPIQHALCSLELDDDVWDEIKNYMKCLMRMFSEKHDKGVVFFETVLSFKHQSHTYIEAVPIPWDLFNDVPAYFRESINSCESEWSQHRKLINFSERPGGFRRCMVSKLPYFMIQWDYKGEKGFGHVIEGNDNDQKTGLVRGTARDECDELLNDNLDDGLKGAQFPRYFAAEIIGNLLELEPRKWRKPKKINGLNFSNKNQNPLHNKNHHHHNNNNNGLSSLNHDRVKLFLNQIGFSEYDWTSML